MLFGRQTEQSGCEQGTLLQIVRRFHQLSDDLVHCRLALFFRQLAEVVEWDQAEGQLGQDALDIAIGRAFDHRAQHALALDEHAPRLIERLDVEWPQQAVSSGDAVDDRAGGEVLKEPHPFLHLRQGCRRLVCANGDGIDRRCAGRGVALRSRQLNEGGCQLGWCGVVEDHAQAWALSKCLGQHRRQFRGHQGVATLLKEVIVGPQAIAAQQLAHFLGHGFGGLCNRAAGRWRCGRCGGRRRLRRRVGTRGQGQCLAVYFVVRQQRQRRQHQHRTRNHVIRQGVAQAVAQRSRVQRSAALRHDVADQCQVTRGDLAGHDHGTRHACLLLQLGLDLAELDAVAANLDLEVHSAKVFDLAVFAPPTKVARAIDQATRSRAPRYRDKAFCRQVGTPVIAQSHPIATNADFPFGSHRQGLQALVQDPDLRVVDGVPDRDLGCGIGDVRQGRPHGGFCGAVHVPDVDALRQQC